MTERALSYLDHTMNGLTSFQSSMFTHSSASDSLLANMKNVACERGRLGRGKEGGGGGREGGGRERRRDGEGREGVGRGERGKEREGQREGRGREKEGGERETGAQWINKILRRHCIPGLCFGEWVLYEHVLLEEPL